MRMTEADRIQARGLGVDLEDAELKARLQSALAERDFALELVDQGIVRLEAARRRAERWRQCWMWTFGLLMLVVVALEVRSL